MSAVLRHLIAGLLLAGIIAWLLFFEHKGYALGAAVIVAYLCRLLVVDFAPEPASKCGDE